VPRRERAGRARPSAQRSGAGSLFPALPPCEAQTLPSPAHAQALSDFYCAQLPLLSERAPEHAPRQPGPATDAAEPMQVDGGAPAAAAGTPGALPAELPGAGAADAGPRDGAGSAGATALGTSGDGGSRGSGAAALAAAGGGAAGPAGAAAAMGIRDGRGNGGAVGPPAGQPATAASTGAHAGPGRPPDAAAADAEAAEEARSAREWMIEHVRALLGVTSHCATLRRNMCKPSDHEHVRRCSSPPCATD